VANTIDEHAGMKIKHSSVCRYVLGYFVRDYGELPQIRGAERSSEGNVGGVASYGHKYAANTRLIVTRIERPPPAFQIHFEPRAEIHRHRRCGNADVAQVAGRVSRGYIQCPAHRYRQMLEIPANAQAIRIHIERRLLGVRILISKRHSFMNPGANSLHAIPSGCNSTEELRGNVRHSVNFAVAAVKQILKHVAWQMLNGYLAGPGRDGSGSPVSWIMVEFVSRSVPGRARKRQQLFPKLSE
jgi:hypothetical protein